MKHLAATCFLIILVLILLLFCQTALDPESFCGEWYSAEDQSGYLFQEGLVYRLKFGEEFSDTTPICGAYTYCRDSVFLFTEGVAGLEKETEIYLVRNRDGSFLCENKDGSGNIYFIRSIQEK